MNHNYSLCQVKDTIKLFPAALYMASHEIKLRYRKSVLGPFWLAISNAIYIVILGLLWSNLLTNTEVNYFKYFAVGQLSWVWISSQITDSGELFVRNERLVNQLTIPLQFYVLKDVLKNFFIFLHNFPTIIIVLILYPSSVFDLLNLLYIIPLVLIFLFLSSSIIALLSLRYRDLAPIISTAIQLLYFITPIIWTIKDRISEENKWIYQINPFYHLITLIRSPLLGTGINFMEIFYMCIVIFCLFFLSMYLYNKYSKKVYFWY